MSLQQLPPPPDGWERVESGKPMLKRGDKRRLQYCPICGPSVLFSIPGESDGRAKIEEHLMHHRPEQFGLESRRGDRGLEEWTDV